MQGRRIADDPYFTDIRPGDYWRAFWANQWHWCCSTPNGHHGNISAHSVVEHELWHGFLERGQWRTV
jgi:hypothetical protein